MTNDKLEAITAGVRPSDWPNSQRGPTVSGGDEIPSTKTPRTPQEAREAQMVTKGHQRYEDRQKRLKGSQTDAGHDVITKALTEVSQVISKLVDFEINRVQSGQGKPSTWIEELKEHDPLVLAYLGLNVCYDSVVTGQTYASTLANIGARIENESFSKGLREYDHQLHKRLVSQVTKAHSSDRYRFKAARIISGKEGYKPERWSGPAKVSIASPVINAILEGCDIFMITQTDVAKYSGKKLEVHTNRHLSLTDSAAQKISERTFDASWASPMFGPLVIPPKPWTSFDTGVYQDETLAALVPMVRKSTKEQRLAIKHDFEKGTPGYVRALNALQATPLRLNEDVYHVIRWLQAENKTYSEFPSLAPPLKTPFPDNPAAYSEEYLLQIKKDRKKWHEDRREAVTNAAVLDEDLRTMDDLKGIDEFWLGWSFDFRGRMYPVGNYNYHRADHIKASFMLANGKPLDGPAQGWLMIQIANVGDFDGISKKSLDDRIDWTLQNEKMILACADDYQATFDVWTEADKPMQFLAACFEYRKFVDQGDDYVCHLPISLDGTNSGTQHYALALRNYEDGLRTNLVPSDHCFDVYQIVADEVQKALELDGSPEAQHWLSYGITRKTVKRNTMCYGYSSVQRGMGDQIIEDLMSPLQRQVAYKQIEEHPFGDKGDQGRYARFLASVNYQVISQTLSSVAAGMQFLQSYADALAREQKSVRWTSTSGFPCVQRYTKSKAQRVRIFLYDREAKLRKQTRVNLQIDTDVYDTRKARSGVSANFVHSLDAGHMSLSIQMGLNKGISDYFLIHDSFGTNCSDTWAFYHCIRESLVDIYDDTCVFSRFEKECRNRLANPDMDLESVPDFGALDISQVVNSEYCFS